jgi:hypothetical protein
MWHCYNNSYGGVLVTKPTQISPLTVGHAVKSTRVQHSFYTCQRMMGCHVAPCHLSKTGHVSTTQWSTCLLRCQTSHCQLYLPRNQYECAMCHPYNGDTCHSQIGLSTSASIHPITLPRQLYEPCHIIANCAYHVICMVVRPIQSATTWHCTDCIVINFLPIWKNE